MSLNDGVFVQNDPVNWVDPEGLSPAGLIIKLTKKGFKKIAKIADVASASRARRQGLNVLAKDRQTARQIERGAFGGQDMMKHSGHDLPGGNTGKPHYQTDGKYGHTFWGAVGAFGLSMLDPFDAISGELGADDMLCSDGTAPPCNPCP